MGKVTVSDASSLDQTGAISIEALVKIRPNTGIKQVLVIKDAAYAMFVGTEAQDGFSAKIGDGSSFTGTVSFDSQDFRDNSYHMYSFTYDDSADLAVLYVDGTEVARDSNFTASLGTNNNDLFFGADSGDNNQINGLYDEVRIWSDERTSSEIDNNKNSNLGGSETGLVGLWEFSSGSGTTITDQTSNNNDGTVSGTNSWEPRGSNFQGRYAEAIQVDEVGADVTAVSGQLPPLSDIGSRVSVEEVETRMEQAFSERPWADPIFRDGPTHGEGSFAFKGCAMDAKSRVIFAPYDSNNVGIYDPSDDTYTSGPAHGEGAEAFIGATLIPDGRIVFAPDQSDNVGLFDPSDDSYTSGPAHNQSVTHAYTGANLVSDGRVVLCPIGSSDVGLFDPSSDSFTSGPSHSSNFSGGVLVPDGRIVFVPSSGPDIGIFDPSDDSYTAGPEPGSGREFGGGTLAPDGRVIFAPRTSPVVGIFDPEDDSYSDGPSVDDNYNGAVVSPTGEIILVPESDTSANTDLIVGIFDPSDDSFRVGPTAAASSGNLFAGGVLEQGGHVIFAPEEYNNVGIFEPYASIPKRITMHPLVRQTGAGR